MGSNGAAYAGSYGMQSQATGAYQQQWGYPQTWDQNQQQAAQMPAGGAGQADYSQQWIEYYR